MADFRTEKDSLGEVQVPAEALWGAQTQRAIENFPISGLCLPRPLIHALAMIKGAAAGVNRELDLLDASLADSIERAAAEVAQGRWDDQFPLDVFQTGSGTSTNMNANEVIARRAAQLMDAQPGAMPVHPNDHVNMGQSSNDVFPTAIHVAACQQTREVLLAGLIHLHGALARRAEELRETIKTGRTHLMDAMPITLGQEIGAWAFQVAQSVERIESALARLVRLPIGGTAVGSGVNTHPEFGRRVAARLAEITGLPFAEAENHFAAQAAMDAPAELSAQIKVAAGALLKIANDLRWMNSGPVAGLSEIELPALQPGSSIMPGKVNPVACEAMMMACVQVIANDAAVALGAGLGSFQLNTMMPLIARNLLESIMILGNAARILADKAVAGFTVHHERISQLIQRNPILATTLNPVIGYDLAAKIAKRAGAEGRPLKDVAAEMTNLTPEDLDRLLDPRQMTAGGILGKAE